MELSSESSDNQDGMDEKTNDLFKQLMRTVDGGGAGSGDVNLNGKDKQDKVKKQDESYKNKAYWNLPENVRNAIDLAKMKSKHSEFYYKLQTLNDKIYVFRTHFYSKMPAY